MKVKKQKRHRRAVRFYKACFGFREPFKVLCDGTFVHQLVVNKITPADSAVANNLGGQVKLYTTSCVLAEMERLRVRESLDAAHSLIKLRCNHEKMDPEACLTDAIGKNNSEHYFLATQDDQIRRKFREVPGVPLMYILRNAIFLEKPSASQHKFASEAEDARSHLSELEMKLLNMKNTKKTPTKAILDESLEPKMGPTIEAKDTIPFKRKRAKGPNPLSCKKKKTLPNTKAAPAKVCNDIDKAVEPTKEKNDSVKSSKKRKRSRKSKKVVEPTN